MIPLGLSAADRRALLAALLVTNRVRIRTTLMDLSQTPLGSLNDYVLDGQVDVDGTQVITRQLSMLLMDPGKDLPFDTDSAATTALFMDRMIQVDYCVLVSGDWQPVPVFTGPVVGLQRDGSQVTVTCQSKEVLALGNVWPSIAIGKNRKKTDAIIEILMASGEDANHLVIPDLASRLPHPMSLYRSNQYWPKALEIAHGLNRQLYYDGNGIARLRSWPGHHYTFTDKQHISGQISIQYTGMTANAVMIVGGVPKGRKTPITAIAVAPASHPLSPIRLGRNGVPRHILLTGQPISIPTIKHQQEADDVAKHKLDVALMQQVDIQFDVIPGSLATADIGDLCHATTEGMTVPFRLSKFSLPLRDGGTASVGHHRNVSVRSIRRHSMPTQSRKR